MDVVTFPSRIGQVDQILAPPLVPDRKPLTICIYCGAASGKRKEFVEQHAPPCASWCRKAIALFMAALRTD